MTNNLTDEALRQQLAAIKPDIVGATAITPSIYKAERALEIAKELNPAIVTVLGGIHGTFMYPQVLGEAPWIDAIVRGEGEQVFLNLVRAVDGGAWTTARHTIPGIAFAADGKIIATPAEPPLPPLVPPLPPAPAAPPAPPLPPR